MRPAQKFLFLNMFSVFPPINIFPHRKLPAAPETLFLQLKMRFHSFRQLLWTFSTGAIFYPHGILLTPHTQIAVSFFAAACFCPFFSRLCQQTRKSGNKVTSLKFHSFPLDKLYFSNLIFTVRSSPPTEKTGFKRLDESSVCFKFIHGTLAQNAVRSEFYRKQLEKSGKSIKSFSRR